MSEEFTNTESSLLKHYIDNLSVVQRMISEPQRELQQLRLDAKTDGLNVDALNLLVLVHYRNLPDGGSKILNDLVAYAISMGIQFDQLTSQQTWEHPETLHITNNLPEEQRTSPASRQFFDHIRLSAQLALGALLSAAMLWYLQ